MALRTTPSSADHSDESTPERPGPVGSSPALGSQGSLPVPGAPAPRDVKTRPAETAPAAGAPAAPEVTEFDRAVRGLKQKWLETQAHLLDDPRDAVGRSDALIDEVIQHLNKALSARRQSIHTRWSSDDKLSTDDLRTIMQDYRQMFLHVVNSSHVPSSPSDTK